MGKELTLMNRYSGLNVHLSRCALVVEDEPAILRVLVLSLKTSGYEPVLSATSAEAALEILITGEECPALVVTDVRLPGMDGVELTRRIKSAHALRGVPVLVMSAYGEPRAHEGDAFLAKPFDMNEFEQVVARFIEPAN